MFGWPIWKHQIEESNIPAKSVLLSQGVNQELSILKETLPCVQHLVLNKVFVHLLIFSTISWKSPKLLGKMKARIQKPKGHIHPENGTVCEKLLGLERETYEICLAENNPGKFWERVKNLSLQTKLGKRAVNLMLAKLYLLKWRHGVHSDWILAH